VADVTISLRSCRRATTCWRKHEEIRDSWFHSIGQDHS